MSLAQERRPVVLVVEDEVLLRMDATSIASDAGATVVEAANADEAIRILESRADITVLFTDIQMPGSIDGLKLAHAIRDRWPPIQIIITSGRIVLSEAEMPSGSIFLGKPYLSADVVGAIHAQSRPR
jgi:CheY-like chemotaxis protein